MTTIFYKLGFQQTFRGECQSYSLQESNGYSKTRLLYCTVNKNKQLEGRDVRTCRRRQNVLYLHVSVKGHSHQIFNLWLFFHPPSPPGPLFHTLKRFSHLTSNSTRYSNWNITRIPLSIRFCLRGLG